jgi:hypothetical protein
MMLSRRGKSPERGKSYRGKRKRHHEKNREKNQNIATVARRGDGKKARGVSIGIRRVSQ